MKKALDLLAHRPPILLLDSVLEGGPDSATASARVDPLAWYADAQGRMPGWFGLELMAQTIAAFSGIRAVALGEEPHMGYLLGTRCYRSTLPAFPGGCELRIHVKLHYHDESGLSAFLCRILLGGEEIATATLKTIEL